MNSLSVVLRPRCKLVINFILGILKVTVPEFCGTQFVTKFLHVNCFLVFVKATPSLHSDQVNWKLETLVSHLWDDCTRATVIPVQRVCRHDGLVFLLKRMTEQLASSSLINVLLIGEGLSSQSCCSRAPNKQPPSWSLWLVLSSMCSLRIRHG